jgi:hypothetical protein
MGSGHLSLFMAERVGKKDRGQAKVAGFLFGTAVGCQLRS